MIRATICLCMINYFFYYFYSKKLYYLLYFVITRHQSRVYLISYDVFRKVYKDTPQKFTQTSFKLYSFLMSSSKIIQLFHFVNHQIQCKKYIFIFTFIFMLLTLHILFYFYFSKSLTSSSPPYISSKESIFDPIVVDLLISLIGFIIGDILFAWSLNKYNQHCLNNIVEKGTRPDVGISEDKLISQPEIIEHLKKILQPYKDQSSYHVVCGEHGTGKTTLTRIASNEVGHGVIYINIPANPNELGKEFGKAINFAFGKYISFTGQLIQKIKTNDKPKISEWEGAIRALNHASAVYKAKHNKPMVIVYDDVSRLVHKNPEILDILQDDAKDNADNRKYIAVFISSEGSVLRRMQSRSAWSRADKPVIEIGDLSEKKSMEYLDKYKIDKADAKKLYELVGGRIVDLKSIADKVLNGQSFEVIKQEILTEVEHKFRTAKLLENYEHHVGKHIIKPLFDFKELSHIAFEKFFKKPEEANEILKSNVFAYHPAKNTVTFQSQSVECYILENADIFLN